MLSKVQRFTTAFFDRVFKRSKRFKAFPFLFLYSPAQGVPRFATSVGKKHMKKAVDRNRLRRQLYAKCEEHLVPLNLGFHVICLYNSSVPLHDTPRVDELFKSFAQHLKQQSKR